MGSDMMTALGARQSSLTTTGPPTRDWRSSPASRTAASIGTGFAFVSSFRLKYLWEEQASSITALHAHRLECCFQVWQR